MALIISRSVLDAIARAAGAEHPREACGLLLGDGDAVTAMTVAPNVAAEPERHFEVEPAALFAALRAERAGGPRLVGYWHSHPRGDASPSVTDAAMAAPDGRLWLIHAPGVPPLLWRASARGAVHGRFDPVAFETGH